MVRIMAQQQTTSAGKVGSTGRIGEQVGVEQGEQQQGMTAGELAAEQQALQQAQVNQDLSEIDDKIAVQQRALETLQRREAEIFKDGVVTQSERRKLDEIEKEQNFIEQKMIPSFQEAKQQVMQGYTKESALERAGQKQLIAEQKQEFKTRVKEQTGLTPAQMRKTQKLQQKFLKGEITQQEFEQKYFKVAKELPVIARISEKPQQFITTPKDRPQKLDPVNLESSKLAPFFSGEDKSRFSDLKTVKPILSVVATPEKTFGSTLSYYSEKIGGFGKEKYKEAFPLGIVRYPETAFSLLTDAWVEGPQDLFVRKPPKVIRTLLPERGILISGERKFAPLVTWRGTEVSKDFLPSEYGGKEIKIDPLRITRKGVAKTVTTAGLLGMYYTPLRVPLSIGMIQTGVTGIKTPLPTLQSVNIQKPPEGISSEQWGTYLETEEGLKYKEDVKKYNIQQEEFLKESKKQKYLYSPLMIGGGVLGLSPEISGAGKFLFGRRLIKPTAPKTKITAVEELKVGPKLSKSHFKIATSRPEWVGKIVPSRAAMPIVKLARLEKSLGISGGFGERLTKLFRIKPTTKFVLSKARKDIFVAPKVFVRDGEVLQPALIFGRKVGSKQTTIFGYSAFQEQVKLGQVLKQRIPRYLLKKSDIQVIGKETKLSYGSFELEKLAKYSKKKFSILPKGRRIAEGKVLTLTEPVQTFGISKGGKLLVVKVPKGMEDRYLKSLVIGKRVTSPFPRATGKVSKMDVLSVVDDVIPEEQFTGDIFWIPKNQMIKVDRNIEGLSKVGRQKYVGRLSPQSQVSQQKFIREVKSNVQSNIEKYKVSQAARMSIPRPTAIKPKPTKTEVIIREVGETPTLLTGVLSTKLIMRSALKPALKPLLKPALKPAVKVTLKPTQKPLLKPALKPALKPLLKPALKPIVKPPIVPPPITPPPKTPVRTPGIPFTFPYFTFDFGSKRANIFKKAKRKPLKAPRRSPTLVAVGERIFATKKAIGEFSGLNIRPILIPTKKKKKKMKGGKRR